MSGMKVFTLPDLGEGLTEEIIEWHVAVGDTVDVDQVVAVVETAKASVDLPCPFAGTVAQLHGAAGDIVPVGSAFITVDTGGGAPDQSGSPAVGAGEQAPAVQPAGDEKPEGSGNVLVGYGTSDAKRTRRRRVSAPTGSAGSAAAKEAPLPGAPALSTEEPVHAPDHDEPVIPEPVTQPARKLGFGEAARVISPLVRKLAAEAGLDLTLVTPTGPGRIILRRDVADAIERGTGATTDWVPVTAAAPDTSPRPRQPNPGPGGRCRPTSTFHCVAFVEPSPTSWPPAGARSPMRPPGSMWTPPD